MKKVLLITYYWPPSGGPGVQRIVKFAKYFPAFGWQPIILTVKNGEYPALDHSLQSEIPESCRVYKTRSLEPNILYKTLTGKPLNTPLPVAALAEKPSGLIDRLAKWVRLNLFIPDAKIGWKPFAIRSGKAVIRKEKPDLILSSSPPPTVHLIARSLSRWSGIPWIADFRDPWTNIYYYDKVKKLSLISRFDHLLEQRILSAADKTVTVSQNVQSLLDPEKRFPPKFTIIPNGFDPDDVKAVTPLPGNNKFIMAYAGRISPLHDSENLWAGLENNYQKSESFRNKLEIWMMGHYSDDFVSRISQFHFSKSVKYTGYLDHRDVMNHLVSADILLLLIANTSDNEGILSGKLFNYLAAGKYILGIGPSGGEAANLLSRTRSGAMYDYETNLDDVIRQLFLNWESGVLPHPLDSEISAYSRKNQAKELVRIMESLL